MMVGLSALHWVVLSGNDSETKCFDSLEKTKVSGKDVLMALLPEMHLESKLDVRTDIQLAKSLERQSGMTMVSRTDLQYCWLLVPH